MVERDEIIVPGAGVEIEALRFGAADPAAAIVAIHGWGGSVETMAGPARRFAEMGYLALSISMRGWGASGGRDDCGLHQPDDVAAVVEWIRSTHPACAERVGLIGISQGGQVALLCAARSARVAAVVAVSAVTDVARWRETTTYPGIPVYIDAVCADGDLARRSPLSWAAALTAPVLLIHGGVDTRVPTEQSRLLHDALTEAGGDSRLEVLEGIGHSRGPAGNTAAFDLSADFFATHLAGS